MSDRPGHPSLTTAELLAIGAELLVGETRDTNSGDLAGWLTELGVEVRRMSQLPDELDVIAAVVIGGGSLSGGEGSILGSMVGALVMAFLRNGSQQMGWPTYVQEILIGVIIVAAVAVDRWRHAQGGQE